MTILGDLERLFATLPLDPIAPEHRRVARLQPSSYVPRGQVYRLAPQPDLTGHQHPLIVMNNEDVDLLRREFAAGHEWRAWPSLDQEIADCAEQLFADRQTRERTARNHGVVRGDLA